MRFALALLVWPVAGFAPARRPRSARAAAAPVRCICIDCAFVGSCATYHMVEDLHAQPHVTDAPSFEPGPATVVVRDLTPRRGAASGGAYAQPGAETADGPVRAPRPPRPRPSPPPPPPPYLSHRESLSQSIQVFIRQSAQFDGFTKE